MEGLKYQLKSISKDKMAILSFFLPVIMAILVNLLSIGDIVSATSLRFVIIENNLPVHMEDCLGEYGIVLKCNSEQELNKIVINPADETIGVIFMKRTNEIKTVLSGDETSNIKMCAEYLPLVLKKPSIPFNVTTLLKPNVIIEFKHLLIALVIITAVFMGCTFNTMNIVSEKEDGIDYVNQILPMSFNKYIFQKTFLGFLCGLIVSIITIFICLGISKNILQILILIIVTSFIASIIGLFIAKISENLMSAIIYIKTIMIIFIAVPLLAYLFLPENSIRLLFCIIPSYLAFDVLMKIINNNTPSIAVNILALIIYCIILLKVYFILERKQYKVIK